EAVCAESLELSRVAGHTLGIISSTANLGRANHLAGNYPEAVSWFQQALSLASQIGNMVFTSWTLVGLAGVALDTSDFAAAERYADEALAISEASGDAWGSASALKILGKRALA